MDNPRRLTELRTCSIPSSGSLDEHPYWSLGLNGSGIVIGVADSGLDADHDCFRNATTGTSEHAEAGAPFPAVGVFGPDHRTSTEPVILHTFRDEIAAKGGPIAPTAEEE